MTKKPPHYMLGLPKMYIVYNTSALLFFFRIYYKCFLFYNVSIFKPPSPNLMTEYQVLLPNIPMLEYNIYADYKFQMFWRLSVTNVTHTNI